MCCSESVPGKIVNQPGSVRACVSCARLYYMTKQQNSVTQDESMVVRALREESEIEEMVVPVSFVCSSAVASGACGDLCTLHFL